MSSSSGPLTEELQCSICLDVFTDPVTIPCGHNFCKTCLKECWDKSEDCNCPLCKESFHKRPDLKINTTLRQVVQLFNEKFSLRKSEVLCDICEESKVKALKSCLVCQSSYCETHLEPHQRVTGLKKHKLIDPVENLENYICQKHERSLELFCRDDQTCVCLSCTEGDHRTHNTVPVEEEIGRRKTQLIRMQADLQHTIQDKIKKIEDIKHLVEVRKRNTEKEKADSVELFTALVQSIERSQTELLEMMEEKQKAAENQAEELIKKLEQEITQLKWKDTELEQLMHIEDHLHLLQTYPSLWNPTHKKDWTEISINTEVSVELLMRAITQLQETLDEKLSQTVLKRMQKYAVDVTLDPDTAHASLILSQDGKQVRDGDLKYDVLDNPKRFDTCLSVLGTEGFSTGRFYFEVQVKGAEWDLGVAKESINRRGKLTLSPEDGYWVVWLRNGSRYEALDSPMVSLSLRGKPQRVGVFVDYEEGLVCFYDLISRSHIYSFTGQSFTEKLYPYFSPSLKNRGKYSPPLIISPVS